MVEKASHIIGAVATYYSDKVQSYGATPEGVDWNGAESQTLRFKQLSKLLPENATTPYSLADLGCGYGAFAEYLQRHFTTFQYTGYDISSDMCESASKRLEQFLNTQIICSDRIEQQFDFIVASGIFNVRLDYDDTAWFDHITSVLDNMNSCSVKGFSFNCLTTYSDKPKMRDHLHYADPAKLFNWCKKKYSHNVALLHDYDLYEFTILVKKS